MRDNCPWHMPSMDNYPYVAEGETEVPEVTQEVSSLSWDWDPGLQVPSLGCCLWAKVHAIIHCQVLIQNFNGLFWC